MPLVRELKPGDTLRIGDTTVTFEKKTGQRTRVQIDTTLPVKHIPAQPKQEPAKPRASLIKPVLQAG